MTADPQAPAEKPFRVRVPLAVKILVLLLGLAILTLAGAAVVSFTAIHRVSAVAVDSNRNLGAYAVDNSAAALTTVGESELRRRVDAQAESSDAVFRRVEAHAKTLAGIAARLWADPRYDVARPPSPTEEPADIYSVSSFVLAPGVRPESAQSDLNISTELEHAFKGVCAHDPVLVAVHVATNSGMLRTFPWRKGWAADFDPRTRDWFMQPIAKHGISWTTPYVSKSNNRLIVTCSMPFYGADGAAIGVIKVDITPQTINDGIINASIGKGGYAFLIDGTGMVIASPRMDTLAAMTRQVQVVKNSPLNNALRAPANDSLIDLNAATDQGLAKAVEKMLRDERGLLRVPLAGIDHYIAFAPVPAPDWSIGFVMPVDDIVAPAKAISKELAAAAGRSTTDIDHHISHAIRLMMLVMVVLLLIATWAAITMARRITRPIQRLSEGTSRLGAGQLDHTIEVATGDEIEKLARDFNAMATNLKAYIASIGEATAARERVESELQVARKIQSSLLPRIFPPFPDRSEIDLYASMEPAREVGGDFFDFFFIDQHRLCLAIGDVSDKGVPASLFMAVTKTLIKTEAMQPGRTVGDILARVNNQLCDENEMLMFVTVFIAILDVRSGEVEFANGGHNPPVVCRSGSQAQFIQPAKGIALAVMPDAAFQVERCRLEQGDLLLIYTDGVNEAMNPVREQFSYPRLLASLDRSMTGSANAITTSLRDDIKVFAGDAPQSDDITIIAVRFHGPG
jgi:sigma-B regulation protein RsbU (phosphoserine phosphatase)